jgi:hypothetical protein
LALGFVPSFAQNPPSVDGTRQFSLIGMLTESEDFIAEDVWTLSPILALYDPIDITCPVQSSLDCRGSTKNSEFRLEIPYSLQWAYWKSKGSPVLLTATVKDSSPINGIYTLLVTEMSSVTTETRITQGVYAAEKRFCHESQGHAADEFSQIRVDQGLTFSAWETSCHALHSQANLDFDAVTFGCFSEGYAYTAPVTFTTIEQDSFKLEWSDTETSQYSLCTAEDQGVYHGAVLDLEVDLRSPKADGIPYGSRVGMYATLVELSGVDTKRAKLVAEILPVNAYEFCAFYSHRFDADCINEAPVTLADASLADCSTGLFTNIWGRKRQFSGLAPRGAHAEFTIVDLESGEDITGSMPAGYYSDIELFETLCPSVVAELLNRPETRPKLATDTYAVAFHELVHWQGVDVGSVDAYQRRLDDLPIWKFAVRMRPSVSERLLKLRKRVAGAATV